MQHIYYANKSVGLEQWQVFNWTLIQETQDLLQNSLLLGLTTYPKLLAHNMSDIIGNVSPRLRSDGHMTS